MQITRSLMAPSSPIPQQDFSSTYRPRGYEMSNALKRARKPFAVRNAITGISIFAFTVGVYAYSIWAVKQDDLSDVDVPPEVKARTMRNTVEESS